MATWGRAQHDWGRWPPPWSGARPTSPSPSSRAARAAASASRCGPRTGIRALTGLDLRAPISGQRALRGDVLPVVVPFAHGFGMEIGMTVDAARAGYRVAEVELDLAHRSTGRSLRGFAHRGRQLADFARVYLDRR